MKRKQMLALCMAAVLTVSMSAGTVSFAEEMDPVQQDTVEREMTEEDETESAEKQALSSDSVSSEEQDSVTGDENEAGLIKEEAPAQTMEKDRAVMNLNESTDAEEDLAINETNFPDTAFREYVSKQYDKDGNGSLSETEITKITILNIKNNQGINDLTGMEYFTSLITLDCSGTAVSSLDVSNHPKLKNLVCTGTQITELNLSNNPALIKVECSNTGLTSLDVTKNPKVTRILCANTGIAALDLSAQTKVSYLDCSGTRISSLDLSGQSNLQNLYCGNTQISELDFTSNPKLKVLDVTNAKLNTLDLSGTKITDLYCEGNPLYTLNIGGRGELMVHFVVPENSEIALEVPASSFDLTEMLPGIDAEKVEIVSGGNLDGTVLSGYSEESPIVYKYHVYDAEESDESVQITVTLNLTVTEEGLAINETNFPDATFREYVSDNFDKNDDQVLSKEEVDAVTSVKIIGKSELTSLKGIEYFTNLTSLHCYSTGIQELDVSANTKLQTLSCYSTAIQELDVTNLSNLKYLYVNDTEVSSLDVTNCPALERLECNNTNLDSIDVSQNPKLTRLECCNTEISSLDVSKNLKLMTLSAENTKLSTINLEVNEDLQTVELEGSPIYAMSIGDKTKKTKMYLSENTELDFEVSEASVDLTTLLPGTDPEKVTIESGGELEGSVLSGYKTGTPVVYTYDYGTAKRQPELKVTLNLTVEEKGLAINETNFPDTAFREYVSKQYDKDGNGSLSETEITKITILNIKNNQGINDLTGMEYFTSLITLDCSGTAVSSLDVSNHPKLKNLVCTGTQITELNLSNNPALIKVECSNTGLTSLDVTKNPKVTRILCANTGIAALDLSAQTKVSYLDCSGTRISSLDLSGQSNLQNLYCGNTQISELDFTSNPKLKVLDVTNAKLGTLDLSGTKITDLYCGGNPLYALNIGGRGSLMVNFVLPEKPEIALDVPASSFDLTEMLPGIDVSKITSVSGGELNGTVLSGYEKGIPVVYTYDYGYGSTKKAPEYLTVVLNLNANQIPVINAGDKELTEGDVFDAKEGVTAWDEEDGDITDRIEVVSNNVDASKAGKYEVTYKVTDSQGESVSKTITVTVVEKSQGSQEPGTGEKPEDGNKPEGNQPGGNQPGKNESNQSGSSGKVSETSGAPKTGDSANVSLWISLIALSGVTVASVVNKKRKDVK